MSWYYNDSSGALTSSGAVQGFLQDFSGAVGLGAGWHKLNIPATDNGDQAAAEARKEFPNGTPPTTSVATQVNNQAKTVPGVAGAETAVGTAANAANSAGQALGSVTDFLSGLTQANLWIRVAMIGTGSIILFIGVAKLTGADKKAGSLAAKAVKVAPLL